MAGGSTDKQLSSTATLQSTKSLFSGCRDNGSSFSLFKGYSEWSSEFILGCFFFTEVAFYTAFNLLRDGGRALRFSAQGNKLESTDPQLPIS